MTSFLQDIVTEFNKAKFAGSIADDGENAAEIGGYTDTGCLMLNAVISGSLFKGFPTNKVTAIAGEEATGKTFIALGITKYHLDSNPDAQVVYFDTEAAITKDMLLDRDIDTKRMMIAEPATIEEFRTMALKIIGNYEKVAENKRPPLIMVLDSLGMLSSDKEVKDTEAGENTRDMTKQQLLKGVFRVLTLRLAQAGIPLIVTNHIYLAIGKGNANYTPKEMGGGCLVMGTLIKTPTGPKEIQEIKIGEVVETVFGPKPVTNTFSFNDKDVYELTLDDGNTVRCSGNHRFLVSGEWMSVANMLDMAKNTECLNIEVADIRQDLDVLRQQIYENLLSDYGESEAA